jgi:Protein involved in cell division
MRDPYINENGVLKNKLQCETKEELEETEKILAIARIIELNENPIRGNYDLKHLQKIHEYIFQDVYEWAGEIRIINIAKGNTLFCPVENIEIYSQTVFDQLEKDKYLKNETEYDFCKKGAEYLGEINMIHPFREGNGRTQREFIKLLGQDAGYEINFKYIKEKQMKEASIRSVTTDNKGFYEILKKSITVKREKSRSR